ncbi:hypothetical protein CTAYLR_007431 [Chrysophaeum taylorii]|uniref:Uncharacterized protein n=1 Tax=Chrysophaeum taylorii TaxID=2483200 RepID=A0AAD7U9C9_9STRA|nr:hypothetical protein CTAYLR_007431 [Chrysophaeum taylorii]
MVDSQDAGVRDRAMEAMREYLRDSLDEVAMRKLWRAVFFAMWLSDLAPVQQELAKRVGGLVHCFSAPEAACRWLAAFCVTLEAEWDRLDKHRLDKYYSLARQVVREAIAFGAWSAESLAAIARTFDSGVLRRRPNGPRLHFCDVVIDEVRAVATSTPYDDVGPVLALLEPFLALLAASDRAVFSRAVDRVVGDILKHDDLPLVADLRAALQSRLYRVAADPSTPDSHRAPLYAALKHLVALTRIPLDDAPPVATLNKRRPRPFSSAASSQTKKRKKTLVTRLRGRRSSS